MPKIKLDHTFCLTAQCEPGRRKTDYWDVIVSGFVLEARSSGGKTYYLRYFDAAGRQRQHKIGGHGEITFDQAKKAAQRLRSEVVLGGSPAEAEAEKKAIPTYAELAEQHIAHAKTYQKRPENTEAVIRGHLIPRFGKLLLTEISQQEVAKWLAEKRDSGLAPATVEKLRVTLGKSFALAATWNLPGGQANPVRGIPRPKYSNARSRYLSAPEAARLRVAIEGSRNKRLADIVWLLLLTGARVSELLHAKRADVDTARKVWFIPDSKTGKSRHVPLSGAAIEIIDKLPTYDKCDLLIPNPKTKKPFVSIKHSWDTARTEAKLPGVRIHDLRHSAASFMINAGIDLYAVGRVLGHADHKSTMRYSHLANDTLLSAVEAGAAGLSIARAGAQAMAFQEGNAEIVCANTRIH